MSSRSFPLTAIIIFRVKENLLSTALEPAENSISELGGVRGSGDDLLRGVCLQQNLQLPTAVPLQALRHSYDELDSELPTAEQLQIAREVAPNQKIEPGVAVHDGHKCGKERYSSLRCDRVLPARVPGRFENPLDLL